MSNYVVFDRARILLVFWIKSPPFAAYCKIIFTTEDTEITEEGTEEILLCKHSVISISSMLKKISN
jgi:hypothetical protein